MKKMNARRLAVFVREFGFLNQIPGLDRVGKIKVARCHSSLLIETGTVTKSKSVSEEFRTIYYTVRGKKVHRLEFVVQEHIPVRGWGSDLKEHQTAEPIGDQIQNLCLTPDFIVCCDNNLGGNWETWTIYKMDKFDLEAWCLKRTAELELEQQEYNSEDVPFTERRDSWGYRL